MSRDIQLKETETLGLVTPPNETYEGKEIPTVITTTE